MNRLPAMRRSGAILHTLNEFAGLDRTETVSIGQFAGEENLSSRCYPALATRLPRSSIATVSAPGGLIAKEHLWYVDGACLKHDNVSVDLGLTSGDKQLLSMGAYLLVWPDKKYLNTADLSDKGSMEQTNTAASVTATPCRSDGRALMAYSAADAAPANPVAGQHWLDTSGDAPILKTYQSDSGAWEAVDTPAVLLTGSGLGHGFSAGDGVELFGFANESLNGLFTLLSATEDTVLIPATLTAATGGTGITASRTIPAMDFVTECDNRIWGCKYGTVDGAAVNEIYACKLGDFTNWRCFQGLSTDSYAASRGSDGPWTAAVTYGGQPLFFKGDCLDKVYPSPTGAHRIVSQRCPGVASGSHRSAAVVDGVLYYLSPQGVCSYNGAVPRPVGRDLGRTALQNGVGGGWDGRYYLSAQKGTVWETLTYDAGRRLWHREDDLHAKVFAPWNGALYCLTSSGALLRMDGGSDDAALPWYAETGPLRPGSPRSQYIYTVVARCETAGRIRLHVRYDDGPWLDGGTSDGRGSALFKVPVRPRRCREMRLKLSGDRPCRVDAVSAYWEGGGDVGW